MTLSIGSSLCAVLTATLSLAVVGMQDAPKRDAAPNQVGDMALKMKEVGSPGAEHEVLESRVGTWSVDVKMFQPGSTTPLSSKGTSEVKWAMDGRFIEESVEGNWMGRPFTGLGMTGYDNIKKKYVGSWFDNMNTGIMRSEGTWDAGTKSFTFTGECPDVMTGQYTHFRSTDKLIDADHWRMETYKSGPDGKDILAGQLDYQRASR